MDTRVDSNSLSVSALLDPMSFEDFLGKHWLKQPLRRRGSPQRISNLLSWATLNRLLEHHWRETYRFRLARQAAMWIRLRMPMWTASRHESVLGT
jgi:hypothetical protein